MTSPAEALQKLFDIHRQASLGLASGIQGYRSSDYAPLKEPGAVQAFVLLSANLKPSEAAQFSLSISRRLPKDAPLQATLGFTYAAAVESMGWMNAYMVLNAAHLNVAPHQTIYPVVVEQLKKLEARSDEQSRPSVTHMLKTMPGGPH